MVQQTNSESKAIKYQDLINKSRIVANEHFGNYELYLNNDMNLGLYLDNSHKFENIVKSNDQILQKTGIRGDDIKLLTHQLSADMLTALESTQYDNISYNPSTQQPEVKIPYRIEKLDANNNYVGNSKSEFYESIKLDGWCSDLTLKENIKSRNLPGKNDGYSNLAGALMDNNSSVVNDFKTKYSISLESTRKMLTSTFAENSTVIQMENNSYEVTSLFLLLATMVEKVDVYEKLDNLQFIKSSSHGRTLPAINVVERETVNIGEQMMGNIDGKTSSEKVVLDCSDLQSSQSPILLLLLWLMANQSMPHNLVSTGAAGLQTYYILDVLRLTSSKRPYTFTIIVRDKEIWLKAIKNFDVERFLSRSDLMQALDLLYSYYPCKEQVENAKSLIKEYHIILSMAKDNCIMREISLDMPEVELGIYGFNLKPREKPDFRIYKFLNPVIRQLVMTIEKHKMFNVLNGLVSNMYARHIDKEETVVEDMELWFNRILEYIGRYFINNGNICELGKLMGRNIKSPLIRLVYKSNIKQIIESQYTFEQKTGNVRLSTNSTIVAELMNSLSFYGNITKLAKGLEVLSIGKYSNKTAVFDPSAKQFLDMLYNAYCQDPLGGELVLEDVIYIQNKRYEMKNQMASYEGVIKKINDQPKFNFKPIDIEFLYCNDKPDVKESKVINKKIEVETIVYGDEVSIGESDALALLNSLLLYEDSDDEDDNEPPEEGNNGEGNGEGHPNEGNPSEGDPNRKKMSEDSSNTKNQSSDKIDKDKIQKPSFNKNQLKEKETNLIKYLEMSEYEEDFVEENIELSTSWLKSKINPERIRYDYIWEEVKQLVENKKDFNKRQAEKFKDKPKTSEVKTEAIKKSKRDDKEVIKKEKDTSELEKQRNRLLDMGFTNYGENRITHDLVIYQMNLIESIANDKGVIGEEKTKFLENVKQEEIVNKEKQFHDLLEEEEKNRFDLTMELREIIKVKLEKQLTSKINIKTLNELAKYKNKVCDVIKLKVFETEGKEIIEKHDCIAIMSLGIIYKYSEITKPRVLTDVRKRYETFDKQWYSKKNKNKFQAERLETALELMNRQVNRNDYILFELGGIAGNVNKKYLYNEIDIVTSTVLDDDIKLIRKVIS